MIMGNFMLLCEFNPDKVYQWFMEMYIDAYDWVMVAKCVWDEPICRWWFNGYKTIYKWQQLCAENE